MDVNIDLTNGFTHGLVVKYGEIYLRLGNRGFFEDKLKSQIVTALEPLGNFHVKKELGRFMVTGRDGGEDFDEAAKRVADVFGVIGVAPCFITRTQDLEGLRAIALEALSQKTNVKSFKVETKRANKNFPMRSQEISALVGGYLLEKTGIPVDVNNPDVVVKIELRNWNYIYAHSLPGFGGLPVGTTGKAMLLLSGGIDSPVAGFLTAKRGVALEAIYFHSPPYTQERALDKVKDLAKRISYYAGPMKLHVVNFTPLQLMLNERVPLDKLTIFLKRAMVRCACSLGEQNGCHAIVTGDAIGQVASQTMHSLLSTESAASLPILRPLAGMDKQEVIALARRIETFEISNRPYEDCCTLFLAKNPETKPKKSIIEAIESKLPIQSMIDEAIQNIDTFSL